MTRYPSCILATCVVPWGTQHEFQEDLFRHQVRTLLRDGTRHLYIFGTAGEGYAVTNRQFQEIVQVFCAEMRSGSAEPMVGVISTSLPSVIERLEMAHDLGVRQFQISLPCWGALADAEVATFFRETCGRFPDSQFLHYNLLRTKRILTAKEYVRLAGEHENLVATKNSTDSMERIHALLIQVPQLRHFLTETGFVYGSLLGTCGLLISLASTNWQSAREFFDAGQRQDAAALIANQRELNAMLHELIATVGGGVEHIDGTFDKVLWRLHDSRFPLRLLPPYEGAAEKGFQKYQAFLRERCPRWLPPE